MRHIEQLTRSSKPFLGTIRDICGACGLCFSPQCNDEGAGDKRTGGVSVGLSNTCHWNRIDSATFAIGLNRRF